MLLQNKWVFDGGKIREKRKEKDLTQKQLAELLGITQASVCEYETGRAVPSLKTIHYLATILNISVDYLLGLTNNSAPIDIGGTMTETEKDLWKAYSALPPEKRERAVGILIGLREG